MSLSNQALTTITTIQAEAPDISRDEGQIARTINAVSEAMAAVAGARTWYYAAAHVEDVRGYGTADIALSAPPVRSIGSIVLRDVSGITLHTYASTEYAIHGSGATGLVTHLSRWPWTYTSVEGYSALPAAGAEFTGLRVTYEGGWVTPWQVDSRNSANLIATQTRSLPYDLEEACISEVVSRLRSRNRDLTIDGTSNAQNSTTYRPIRRNDKGLSPQTVAVARRYWLGPS